MNPCLECGFTYGALDRSELVVALHSTGPGLAGAIRGCDRGLLTRRRGQQWSALEYVCHVRDVFLMQHDRLIVALVEDTPSFKPMYRDQRVAFDGYNEQDPDLVADQVAMATALFANDVARLTNEQWPRPLVYNFPAPSQRDVEWMAHHSLHEGVHHRIDVDRILGLT